MSKHTPEITDEFIERVEYETGFGTDGWDMVDPRELIAVILKVAGYDALLAACKAAVELYGKPGGPWNVPSDPGSWIAQARAAIALAEPK